MGMEIERKWMVQGWPEGYVLLKEEEMRQGYISVKPTVRIREEKLLFCEGENQMMTTSMMSQDEASQKERDETSLNAVSPMSREDVLQKERDDSSLNAGSLAPRSSTPLKDEFILCFKSKGRLSRKEIEFPIEEARFRELEDLIGLPLIPKLRRTYQLPDGHHLEVNHVDEGAPTEFWYAEVEFGSEDEARSFDPATVGLGEYLTDDVTEQPGQSMGAYWAATRLQQA